MTRNRSKYGLIKCKDSAAISINDSDGPSDITEFQKLAEDGEATVQDLRTFLTKTKARLSSLPLANRHDQAAHAGGEKALLWLWEYRLDARKEDLDYRGLFEPLCWLLAAEHNESFVIEWVKKSRQTIADQGVVEGSRDWARHKAWCGNLLGWFIEAKLQWSPHGSVDPALEAMKRIVDALQGTVALRFKMQSVTAISSALTDDDRPPCNAALYEWFIGLRKMTDPREYTRHLDSLFHPASPDPLPYARWASDYYEHPKKPKEEIKKLKALRSVGAFMLRAAYISRLLGDVPTARKMEDLVQEHHPLVWGYRQRIARKANLNLGDLHAKAKVETSALPAVAWRNKSDIVPHNERDG